MDLIQLRYFVSAAEQRSLTQAAELLAVSQPTLSRVVRSLEAEMKTYLFSRNGRGVQLTASGRKFLDHARGILRSADAAVQAMRDTDDGGQGQVLGGLPPSIGKTSIPTLVARFVKRFPNAFLSIGEGLSDVLYEQMLAGRLDFAVMHNPPAASQLSIERIRIESFYLIGTKTVGSRKDVVGLVDLEGLPLIVPSAANLSRGIIDSTLARAGMRPNVVMEIDAVGSLFSLIEAGFGYSVVPESTMNVARSSTQLYCQRIDTPELATPLCFVTPARPPKTMLQSAAVGLAREVLKEILMPKQRKPGANPRMRLRERRSTNGSRTR